MKQTQILPNNKKNYYCPTTYAFLFWIKEPIWDRQTDGSLLGWTHSNNNKKTITAQQRTIYKEHEGSLTQQSWTML